MKRKLRIALENDTPTSLGQGNPEATTKNPEDEKNEGKQQSYSKKKAMANRYRYGNFDGYYSYRITDDLEADPRLQLLKKEMFEGKTCLDVGCNSGLVLLNIAKLFQPKLIVGIDIDEKLIKQAQHNLNLQYSIMKPQTAQGSADQAVATAALEATGNEWTHFPISFPLTCGFVPFPKERRPYFPFNVDLRILDFVESNPSSPDKYDVILFFSLTKWIHLNWGDEGLKEVFRKTHSLLNEGGVLLLEPQPFSSYHKKSKFNEDLRENLRQMKFMPDQFEGFLLNEVGFKSVESLGSPDHSSQGFRRPILVFKK